MDYNITFNDIEITYILASAVIGIIIGFIIFRLFYSKKLSGIESSKLQTELDIRQEQLNKTSEENAAISDDLEDLKQVNARLQSDLEHEKKATLEKMDILEKAKQQMSDNFKALSQDALSSNRDAFLSLAKENLEKIQSSAKGDLDKRQDAIQNLITPVNQSLEKMGKKLSDLESARVGAYESLKEHMVHMKNDQDKLRHETSSLVQALRSPATRGQWGEMQLKRTLEMAGMVEGQHYQSQVNQKNDEGGQHRPDVVVNAPGGQSIIIDSKAPIEAYLDSLKEGISENDRKLALKKHAKHVKDHMKALGQKKYWDSFEDSPEFVVMFLPGESYFSAALQEDPSLLEFGAELKVLPSSPTTLISLLKAVVYGWRQERLAEDAKEISETGRELHKRLNTFFDHIQKIGKGLNGAMNSYNNAIGSLERSVMPSVRKFETLNVAPEGKEIDHLDQVEQTARVVNMPEKTDVK